MAQHDTDTPSYEQLKREFDQAGQGHVFKFYNDLSEPDKRALISQVSTINPTKVNKVYETAVSADLVGNPATLSPPSSDRVGSVFGPRGVENSRKWADIGLKATREGKVAVLLMAGGQGTRLGSSAPKGCYDIGLPSHKSLFQLQAERIKKLQELAAADSESKVVVPWYVMTSGPTREPTQAFFKQHDFFGLDENDVVFFEQGVFPCLTNEGKIMLDSPSHVAVAPDGNGGIYAALRAPLDSASSQSVLSDMAARGIEFVHAYGVDNCLVRVADPVFIGYNISRSADCGAKVVKKVDPQEAVGVIALRGDKYNVVEYSEIPTDMSNARETDTGDLVFRAANIVNHFYTRSFLESVESFEHAMAYHVARKKIPTIDLETGQPVKPTSPNGMKLELFVFDVFPFTNAFSILEVGRETDFSPLKNAPGTGSDDPQTSRRDLMNEHKRWLHQAGATVAEGVQIEISPLVSYAGEGLETVKGRSFAKSGHVQTLQDFEALEKGTFGMKSRVQVHQ
ncbi:UDP-N-acetylglucosamine pyrophosphorylase [Microbotryomycetes sp. JL201]|nr:UDP-N-acetylglucosamine pyrophosphorylase [Microbotryomycetes sp. JL201]